MILGFLVAYGYSNNCKNNFEYNKIMRLPVNSLSKSEINTPLYNNFRSWNSSRNAAMFRKKDIIELTRLATGVNRRPDSGAIICRVPTSTGDLHNSVCIPEIKEE